PAASLPPAEQRRDHEAPSDGGEIKIPVRDRGLRDRPGRRERRRAEARRGPQHSQRKGRAPRPNPGADERDNRGDEADNSDQQKHSGQKRAAKREYGKR